MVSEPEGLPRSQPCGFNLCRMNLDYLVIKLSDKRFHGFCVHFKCKQQEKARGARGPGLRCPPGRAFQGLWAGPAGGGGGLGEEPPEGPRGRAAWPGQGCHPAGGAAGARPREPGAPRRRVQMAGESRAPPSGEAGGAGSPGKRRHWSTRSRGCLLLAWRLGGRM